MKKKPATTTSDTYTKIIKSYRDKAKWIIKVVKRASPLAANVQHIAIHFGIRHTDKEITGLNHTIRQHKTIPSDNALETLLKSRSDTNLCKVQMCNMRRDDAVERYSQPSKYCHWIHIQMMDELSIAVNVNENQWDETKADVGVVAGNDDLASFLSYLERKVWNWFWFTNPCTTLDFSLIKSALP